MAWTRLPESLLEEIGDFLTLWERRRWWASSKSLWKIRDRLEANQQSLTWTSAHDGCRYLLNTQHFVCKELLKTIFLPTLHESLLSLNLSHNCSDGILVKAFGKEGDGAQRIPGLFPNLQTLSLRECSHISDFGMECLRQANPPCLQQLQVLDITFCNLVSYACTLKLRRGDSGSLSPLAVNNTRSLPNLKVIRRQPEWLDGHFETPFDGAIQNPDGSRHRPEIHTYYADGAFTFNRNHQSHGFVSRLRPIRSRSEEEGFEDVDENGEYVFLVDKLQYNNFQRPEGWPNWTQFCYRPGVCLLKLPPPTNKTDRASEAASRGVLVGQHMRHLSPPTSRALMEHAKDLVPLGKSRFFDQRTMELLPTNGNELPENAAAAASDVVMVSKMRVGPLEVDQRMPPEDLVQACRNTCTGMESFGTDFLDFQEMRLNILLSGGANEDGDEEID